jgi:hypothetical protein
MTTPTKLSPTAESIFEHVREALLTAEGLGGPEGADYLALMRAVAAYANDAADSYAVTMASDAAAAGRRPQAAPVDRATADVCLRTDHPAYVATGGLVAIREKGAWRNAKGTTVSSQLGSAYDRIVHLGAGVIDLGDEEAEVTASTWRKIAS